MISGKLFIPVVPVMGQTSQDQDPDQSQDQDLGQTQELRGQDQDQNQDQVQGQGQDQGPGPGPDHPQDTQDLIINLVLVLTLALEAQTRKSNLMLRGSQEDLGRVEVMGAIEALGVKKAKSCSRLVKEKLPLNFSQPFQMIQILIMKKICQDRSRKKYQKKIRRMILI